jgi:transcriptional regulator with XRE-family HTH domain
MPRPEGPIDPSSPYAALATALRDLRRQRGIGYRELEKRANYSRSVLSDAASGRQLPRWPVVRAYVRACAGELTEDQQAEWLKLWADARDRGNERS